MNLYHLGYFLVLAQTEHYGKAAKILKITQPSLSHAMSALEEEVGVPLFEKAGRNIVLTRYGKLFLNTVTNSLDTLDEGIQSLKDIRDGKGVIRLCCTVSAGSSLLPRLIKEFLSTEKGQGVQFQISTESSPAVLDRVRNHDCDIGCCFSEIEDEAFTYTPYNKEIPVLLIPMAHPLSEYYAVTLSQTLQYPHIFFPKDHELRDSVEALFSKSGKFPPISYEIDNPLLMAQMVSENLGIAIMPEYGFLKSYPLKILHISGPDWKRRNYLVTRKEGYQIPAVCNFIEYCKETLGQSSQY